MTSITPTPAVPAGGPVRADLFNQERALTPAERKRLRGGPQPKGYAAPPGSGPAGETCGSCDHLARVRPGNRSFPKCGLMERGWTGGTASDVRVRSPACSRWTALPTDPQAVPTEGVA